MYYIKTQAFKSGRLVCRQEGGQSQKNFPEYLPWRMSFYCALEVAQPDNLFTDPWLRIDYKYLHIYLYLYLTAVLAPCNPGGLGGGVGGVSQNLGNGWSK